MLHDDARIAIQPTGAVLHEVGIGNLAMRSVPVPFCLAVASLTLAMLLNGSLRPFDAPWWRTTLGWLFIGLIFALFVVYPMGWAAKLLGQRYEYVFDQSQQQLWARSRWFGVVLWARRYGFDRFERVCVRRELLSGFPVSRWGWTVNCEGQAVSIRLVRCSKPQRASELAEAIAAQTALPVQNECDEAG
jgi:hypothetical protein